MKVAIVHEKLLMYAGSERVLEELLRCFPQAELFSLVDFLPPGERAFLGGRPVRTSFLQHLPLARRRLSLYVPFMPLALEQLDLAGYDVVISNSHGLAQGVLTGPLQVHVCYCNALARYGWDQQRLYLREAGLERGVLAPLARVMLARLRVWDQRTPNGVDAFVANSRFVARNVRKLYRREAAVIYPPVDTDAFTPGGPREDFYLTASRLSPYKRVELIVEAFRAMPGRRLVVAGDGPEVARIKALAGPNVTLLGQLDPPALCDWMRRARAFVCAAEEYFGIAPIEAQACATPVIAYGRGGALETIRGAGSVAPTGVFFPEQTPEALRAAVERFEALAPPIRPEDCRANALRFAGERFRRELTAFVTQAWQELEADTR